MNILKRIDVFLIRWPFSFAISHSLATNQAAQNLVVKLSDDQGGTGWGEGVPRSYVTGEDLDQAVDGLREVIADKLLGRALDPADPLGRLEQWLDPELFERFPAVCCALEIALLDLAGKTAGLPLHRLLGGRPAGVDQASYSAVVPLLPEAATDQVLAMIKTMGMSQVKVKAGRPDDLSRLRRVRQTLGPEADLRLDVNGAWTVDQALTSIPELAEVGLSSVEQPVAKEDFAGLARLRQGTGIRIVADESCCTADQARELIDLQAVDGLNLKLSKCGGFSRTLDIMALADRSGVFCQLGCQVGELGILSAAGRHLASARPDLAHREGCLTRFFLGRDLIAEDLSPGPGGWVTAPQGPGLGVQVLEERIAPDLLISLKA